MTVSCFFDRSFASVLTDAMINVYKLLAEVSVHILIKYTESMKLLIFYEYIFSFTSVLLFTAMGPHIYP